MKTLCLFRHGKSSWSDASLPDRDRPLNARGQRDVPLMAEQFQKLDIRPSLIMASPANRAWSTGQLLADQFGYPREFMHRDEPLYLASLKTLLEAISNLDDSFNNVVLVGHNPGLTELANYFVADLTDNLPTSGFVAIKSNSRKWKTFAESTVELVKFDRPSLHRR